jgi:uncharacterized protein (DUF1684 family)
MAEPTPDQGTGISDRAAGHGLARRCLPALACSLVMLGCGQRPSDDDLVREIETWRAERVERLRAEDGWLTLAGLFWLEPGENRVGSADESSIRLDGLPEQDGTFLLTDDRTVWAFGGTLAIGGEPIADARALASDAQGEADEVEVGAYRLHVIDRSGRLGIRARRPDHPARAAFAGIDAFPVDPAFRVEARLEPFDQPREMAIATVVGTEQRMLAPGELQFELEGRSLSLLPLIGEAGQTELFLIFRDQTSGRETYGAGRFLSADLRPDGRVTLDFNRAINPPCAFTPFATCPLPPPENQLDIAIRAGERYSGS